MSLRTGGCLSALANSKPIRFRDIKRLAVMNNSLKQFQAWRSRRQHRTEQRSLERWEKIRARGKARFVSGSALTCGLTAAGILDVIDNVFYGGTKYSLLSNAILYMLMGLVIALFTWWDMEGKYNAALIDARVKASPGGQLPSHSNPSQITAD